MTVFNHEPSPDDANADSHDAELSAPQNDFDVDLECSDEPPRAMPSYAKRSRYVQARKATVWTLLMVGSACCLTHPLPFVQTLSWYLLPIGYLNWVGWGLLVLAVFCGLRNITTLGFLEYLRSGKLLTGRVLQVGVRPGGTSEAPTGQFVADVEFLNPEMGHSQTLTLTAPESFPLSRFPKLDAGVSPGDEATLIYYPDRLATSLQLFGWLGLHPDLDLIRKNGRPLKPVSPMTVLLYVVGGTLAGWALMGFVYVIGRYTALDDKDWPPYAIGIGLATIPFMVLILRQVKIAGMKPSAVFISVLLALFFSLFGGFMVGFTTVGFLNGFFDRSPPHLEPVKVVQLWHQTTDFILRTYELEYHPYPNGTTEKKMVTVETLSEFQPDSLGVIDIGSGWLGMRWLRNFHPIVWRPVEEGHPEPVPGEVQFQLPGELHPTRIAPWVSMSKTTLLPPPEPLLPELRSRIRAYLTNDLKAAVIEPDKN